MRLLITYDASHVTGEPVGKYLNDTFVDRAVEAFPHDYLEFNPIHTAERLYSLLPSKL